MQSVENLLKVAGNKDHCPKAKVISQNSLGYSYIFSFSFSNSSTIFRHEH